ncbi:MAG: CBS domain-containing protein [bacterium]
MITVGELMTHNPYTLESHASVLDCHAIMASSQIKHVPIVDNNGKLLGIVSESDVLATLSSSLKPSDDKTLSRLEASATVTQIMTKHVTTISSQDKLRRAGLDMIERKIGCLPVVDDGQLVGIITETDFVATAISLIEQLELSEPAEQN